MTASIFSGTLPALMTPCTEARTPDFDALVRKAEQLRDHGMGAMIYAGSMGDWPLLTDAERMEGVDRLVGAGIPVIVGTGAVNTRTASDGVLLDVCESTNTQRSLDDYLRRAALTVRDPRGGAMALIFATELAGLGR